MLGCCSCLICMLLLAEVCSVGMLFLFDLYVTAGRGVQCWDAVLV